MPQSQPVRLISKDFCPDMNDDIERLLLEVQRSHLSERRTESRHAFARPVSIFVGDQPGLFAFSKDMSNVGIGIICEHEFAVGAIAVLKIHSVKGSPVYLRAETRWCDGFGKGWFLTGWKFIAPASPPAAAIRNVLRSEAPDRQNQ